MSTLVEHCQYCPFNSLSLHNLLLIHDPFLYNCPVWMVESANYGKSLTWSHMRPSKRITCAQMNTSTSGKSYESEYSTIIQPFRATFKSFKGLGRIWGLAGGGLEDRGVLSSGKETSGHKRDKHTGTSDAVAQTTPLQPPSWEWWEGAFQMALQHQTSKCNLKHHPQNDCFGSLV